MYTLEHSAAGASQIDTPIQDAQWIGRFVERIRESWIHRGASFRIDDLSEKSNDFAAYVLRFWFWGFKHRHLYRGSEMEWPFRRENSRIKSQILDRDASFRIHGFSKESNDFA